MCPGFPGFLTNGVGFRLSLVILDTLSWLTTPTICLSLLDACLDICSPFSFLFLSRQCHLGPLVAFIMFISPTRSSGHLFSLYHITFSRSRRHIPFFFQWFCCLAFTYYHSALSFPIHCRWPRLTSHLLLTPIRTLQLYTNPQHTTTFMRTQIVAV